MIVIKLPASLNSLLSGIFFITLILCARGQDLCSWPCTDKHALFSSQNTSHLHVLQCVCAAVNAICDHAQSGRVYNFGRVCMSVCQSITFESLDVGSSYLHMRHISTQYGSSSHMKVIRSRSRLQEPKRSKIPIPTM